MVSHVVVAGNTRIGARTKIFPFATIGLPSQDMKARGETGRLIVGADCIIREGVTLNAGGREDGDATQVGDLCVLLAYSHVAHECHLGRGVILSNNVLLGGHVKLGDHAMIGGASAVHQYVRIGAHAFVGGLSGVEGDVAPFALASGNRAHLFGLNTIGLRRRGFSSERISKLKSAFQMLFARADTSPFASRIDRLARLEKDDSDIALIIEFLRAPSERPLCAPRAGKAR